MRNTVLVSFMMMMVGKIVVSRRTTSGSGMMTTTTQCAAYASSRWREHGRCHAVKQVMVVVFVNGSNSSDNAIGTTRTTTAVKQQIGGASKMS